MEMVVLVSVVCLLIYGYALDSRIKQGLVFGLLQLVNLYGYGTEFSAQPVCKTLQIRYVDIFSVMSADQKDVSEPCLCDGFGLFFCLFYTKPGFFEILRGVKQI